MTDTAACLKVLLAGFAGLGTQNHQRAMYLPALAKHPGFSVVGVYDGTGADPLAAEAAAELGVAVHSDIAEAVQRLDVDVVSVCLPLEQRARGILAALRAGAHVFADKPMTATPEEAREVAVTARQLNRICTPAHHLRFQPVVRSAAAAIAAGRIGLPWNVQAVFVVAGGDRVPEGELTNFAVYPLDVVLAMTGQAVQRVHALTGEYWSGHPRATSADSAAFPTRGEGRDADNDLALLLLDHAHGLTSTIVVGRRSAIGASSTMHSYRVSGSHGVLMVDATKPAALVESSSGNQRRWDGSHDDTVAALVDELYTAVRGGRSTQPGPQDAVAIAEIIAAAQESARSGHPVHLDNSPAVTKSPNLASP